jgi:hypothetical protein
MIIFVFQRESVEMEETRERDSSEEKTKAIEVNAKKFFAEQLESENGI